MSKLEETNAVVLKALRENYGKDWPKNQVGYNMLNNYLKWIKTSQDRDGLEEFKAYCLNGDWSDGTFIFTHYNLIYGDTLSEDKSILTNALCLLNLDKSNQLRYFFPESNRTAVWEFIKRKGLHVHYEWPFLMLSLAPEDAVQIEVPQLPHGMYSKPLAVQDVKEVKDNWPFSYPLCEKRLECLVKYNISVGIYTKDGKLAGWTLRYEFGAAAVLHVHEAYRKQGLAKYLIKALAKQVGEQGEYSYSTIVEQNELSRRLFESVGYKWDGYLYLLEIYPSENENLEK